MPSILDDNDGEGKLARLAAIYCSNDCKDHDWQTWHNFECRGELTSKDIARIERTNAFIKNGRLRTASETQED